MLCLSDTRLAKNEMVPLDDIFNHILSDGMLQTSLEEEFCMFDNFSGLAKPLPDSLIYKDYEALLKDVKVEPLDLDCDPETSQDCEALDAFFDPLNAISGDIDPFHADIEELVNSDFWDCIEDEDQKPSPFIAHDDGQDDGMLLVDPKTMEQVDTEGWPKSEPLLPYTPSFDHNYMKPTDNGTTFVLPPIKEEPLSDDEIDVITTTWEPLPQVPVKRPGPGRPRKHPIKAEPPQKKRKLTEPVASTSSSSSDNDCYRNRASSSRWNQHLPLLESERVLKVCNENYECKPGTSKDSDDEPYSSSRRRSSSTKKRAASKRSTRASGSHQHSEKERRDQLRLLTRTLFHEAVRASFDGAEENRLLRTNMYHFSSAKDKESLEGNGSKRKSGFATAGKSHETIHYNIGKVMQDYRSKAKANAYPAKQKILEFATAVLTSLSELVGHYKNAKTSSLKKIDRVNHKLRKDS